VSAVDGLNPKWADGGRGVSTWVWPRRHDLAAHLFKKPEVICRSSPGLSDRIGPDRLTKSCAGRNQVAGETPRATPLTWPALAPMSRGTGSGDPTRLESTVAGADGWGARVVCRPDTSIWNTAR